MADLIKRLRASTSIDLYGPAYEPAVVPPSALSLEAASLIQALTAQVAVMGEALEQVQNTTHPSTGYSDLSARRSAFKVASEARLAATKEPS